MARQRKCEWLFRYAPRNDDETLPRQQQRLAVLPELIADHPDGIDAGIETGAAQAAGIGEKVPFLPEHKSPNSQDARLSSERGCSPWRATIRSQTGALSAIHVAS